MRPRSLTALLASAVLGVALGIGAGLVLDGGLGSDGTDPSSGDPLAVGAAMVNQPCNGGYVIAIGKGNGASALSFTLAAHPTGRYLDTSRSCLTAWREYGKPAPRYIAYLGPYDNGQEACTARNTPTFRGSTVSLLQSGYPTTIHCLCYVDYQILPTLQVGMEPKITDTMWTFALQNLLVALGRASKPEVNGVYGPATAAKVRVVQRQNALPVTGVVDADTWHALQDGCSVYDEPSPNTSPS